ncbi:hypothetical protein J4E93_010098 [Alternaria ventricosa]|uniref:uncharacterized protein n=1 Tax=Alternaria ventricosa TaxID=1187951 RepID=UPI0020C442F5|nr:uncharacterized protein J4E93_010098 [Alternaria ventricosa]KAI4638543.1 hypothetical protein J4E93_010098 [Alternaria ventricosa]
MDPTDRNVDSGGGAVFQGNITAGRDITINQITEIRQATERLSIRYSGADASDRFLGSLEALSGAAEFTEDYAKELSSSVFASDPLLENVSRECASILNELKQLETSLGQDENGQNAITASFNEIVMDIRSRLMSLQMHISNVNSRKTAKDFEAIKEAVAQLMESHKPSDDASSIRSFFTASSIPYVERQIWQEIEKALRAQFTAEYVRDHYALIVASVEELVFEDTPSWVAKEAKPENPPPEASTDSITGDTLRMSQSYNIAKGSDKDVGNGAPLHLVRGSRHHIEGGLYAIDPAVQWSRSVEGGTGECLLTIGS